MGSTRLPGKVLADIGGRTMLARVVARLARSRLVDAVMVATTTAPADDAVAQECARLEAGLFRGSEDDVLDRYERAATAAGARTVVRITADCPLIDPAVVDRVIRSLAASAADYASNILVRTYPRGLDTEAFSVDALHEAWARASEPYQRAHVTPYLYEHSERFRLVSVVNDLDASSHRWTVDTPDDLRLLREIYARLENRDDIDWREALALVTREPMLAEINRGVDQKPLEQC
jgi:spore coat polysaccharide biosynthesis protein SpsF